jgi:DNA-binding transcriptional LysR family regulator
MLSRKTWSGLYNEIIALCNPIIQQKALEFQTVIGLVAAGLGIAVVPQSAMNLHTQHVVYLDLNNQLPSASMGVSWRRNNQSPLVKAFIEIAKEMR